ncbi:AAA family ATPase [uncultured Tenacibaculum sp.]|uniref:AAA family ATPase n=1 Tax=uncultured Tenacibaculum sp. TaxID=174713 RepID=UPI0026207CB3|nr:AAA family ATPase [uncultured Tenacibaculum sp.]
MSFKIIAIQPLENCLSEHLKVLNPNEIYYFYKDYKVLNDEKGNEEIKYESKAPESLFNVKGKEKTINVNISAIVGKNGSGKSTIVELLFKAINNIASNFKLEEENPEKTIIPDIEVVKGVSVVLYYQRNNEIFKIKSSDAKFDVYRFEHKQSGKYTLKEGKYLNFNLSKLFYTEVINYSHYAYNSDIEGIWIQKLFHKNDSYQTPVVFNPMRTKGDTNINRENNLVKQRLIANLLRNNDENSTINFRNIGENLRAVRIKLSLKPQREVVEIYPKRQVNFGLSKFTEKERNTLLERTIQVIIDPSFIISERVSEIDKNTFDNAKAYVLYKLISISIKYDEYKRYFVRSKKSFREFEKYLGKLKNDDSHITFKLRQILYFIYFNHISFDSKKDNYYKLNNLSDLIAERQKRLKDLSIIELIPPPIFDTEILLENIEGNTVSFNTLSSGEKQLVYSISSILYHLTNLDSVSNNKIQYRHINVVMEEIELYFHPDLQRRFIAYLLKGINDIRLKNIEAINICFITHSPFILSDLPSNNVLFLKVNKEGVSVQNENNRKTFGANIHDILNDSFFFEDDIYIGEYVKNKIDKVLEYINSANFNKNTLAEIDKTEIDEIRKLISIIDERIIKIKLSEMLSELLVDDSIHDKLIDKEIEYLVSLKKNKEV